MKAIPFQQRGWRRIAIPLVVYIANPQYGVTDAFSSISLAFGSVCTLFSPAILAYSNQGKTLCTVHLQVGARTEPQQPGHHLDPAELPSPGRRQPADPTQGTGTNRSLDNQSTPYKNSDPSDGVKPIARITFFLSIHRYSNLLSLTLRTF